MRDGYMTAVELAQVLNATGYVIRYVPEENLYILQEPGHPDGWHSVATVVYDETEDKWTAWSIK